MKNMKKTLKTEDVVEGVAFLLADGYGAGAISISKILERFAALARNSGADGTMFLADLINRRDEILKERGRFRKI